MATLPALLYSHDNAIKARIGPPGVYVENFLDWYEIRESLSLIRGQRLVFSLTKNGAFTIVREVI